MMEEELAALKRILISLVVSSPTTMTVNNLVKDYRNMVGGTLPVSKFGYRDYITFLKERCLDIFVVEGSSWDPVLTPKVTKNLKHIDQMVQKQKVQPSIKHKGKRRSINVAVNPPQKHPPQRNLVCETFKRNNVRVNNNNSSVNRETTSVHKAEPKVTPIEEPNVPNPLLIETKKHNGYKDKDSENINNSNERTSSNLSKFFKKRLPLYTSEMDLQGNDADGSSKGSNDSGAHSSGSSKSKLEEMKNEIVELIRDSAEGVWFTDLMRLYKERYGCELSLHRFGHSSLGNLVSSLQDRITVTRPDPLGDYLLRDPGSAAASGRSVTLPVRRSARHRSTRDFSTNPDDALPGIEIDADVYPEDCMHYLERIPSADLSALAGGSQLEVLIGEVYSPSHFWLQQVGPEHNLAMEAVMDQMNVHYASDARELVPGAVRVGQYCAALYEKDWHRSLIVQVVDSDTVKVRHVDYGTVDTVATSLLRYLLHQFGQLRAQAVRARLAACRPSARGQRWPHAAATDFLRAVRDKRLYANIVAVDREEDIVETFLTDTSGATDVCLTRALVRLGHADPRHDSALARDESYLYPRFDALENASTPNYAEIRRLLDDGIQLEFVDAYRRHVPAPSATPIVPSAPPAPLMELVNRVPLLCLESPSPAASEEHDSPTPQSVTSQPSLSQYQLTLPSLPHYQNTQSQYQTAQPQHQMTQPQYQINQPLYQTNQPLYQTSQPRYQSGQDLLPQFQKSQVQLHLSQYQTNQPPICQYQTTQCQYQTTQSQYKTTHCQHQTAQGLLSQLQSPQRPHSQYPTSQPPPSQVQTTQSAIFQLLPQCKATQQPSSQYRPTHSQVQSMFSLPQSQSEQTQLVQNSLSQWQSVQPSSTMQTLHPALQQSQILHPSLKPSPQTTLPQPPMQRPVHPSLAPSKAAHSSVAQTRSPRPFIRPTLPVRPQQLLTPSPARPTLLPTTAVRPTPLKTPLGQPSFQPTVPPLPPALGSTQPHLSSAQVQPPRSSAPVQPPLSSAPVQPPRSSTPAKPPLPSASAQSSLSTALAGLESPGAPSPAPDEVRLTEAEWSMLKELRTMDSVAAEWFVTVTALRAVIERDLAPPPRVGPFDSAPAGESGGTFHFDKYKE